MNTALTMPVITDRRQVSARDVHASLAVKTQFRHWWKRRTDEYEFTEGEDFVVSVKNDRNSEGRPATDYLVSMDMAKELAMLENNEAGRKMRRYFIDAEKRLVAGTLAPPALPESALSKIQQINAGMIDVMHEHAARIETLETTVAVVAARQTKPAPRLAPPHPDDAHFLAALEPDMEYRFQELAELCRDLKLFPRILEGADHFGKWKLSDTSVSRLGLHFRSIAARHPDFIATGSGRHRRFIHTP